GSANANVDVATSARAAIEYFSMNITPVLPVRFAFALAPRECVDNVLARVPFRAAKQRRGLKNAAGPIL
ncbi:MAG: hypothetical protein ABWZ19_05270, partial [Hyphomicrobium sp.]